MKKSSKIIAGILAALAVGGAATGIALGRRNAANQPNQTDPNVITSVSEGANTLKPVEPAPEKQDQQGQKPAEPAVQYDAAVGDKFFLLDMTTNENGENGITLYYTEDGKTLTPFTDWDEDNSRWVHGEEGVLFYPSLVPTDNYTAAGTSASENVAIGYKVPETGAVELYTWVALQGPSGEHGYRVSVAQGDPANVVEQFEVSGDTQTIEDYAYGLKVTKGEELFLIFESLVPADGEWFGFKAEVTYTGLGENAVPTVPVNESMGGNEPEQADGKTILFTQIIGPNNGTNGLTFYYTADGSRLTPFNEWDAAESKWWHGSGGVLAYPCLVPNDNYGLFGSSASEYVVLGYKLPATGTIDVDTWVALQSGHDYQVQLALGGPQDVVKTYDVKGESQTIAEDVTRLDVTRGDVLYIHYKPLEAADGAWGGYKVKITYASGGEDYEPFDVGGTVAPVSAQSPQTQSGETYPLAQITTNTNGENGVTLYYTSDGRTLTPFTEWDSGDGKWYHGDQGVLFYPSLAPKDNYTAAGTSASEYVAISFDIPKTGAIELYTWLALQGPSGEHGYRVKVALGEPDNVLYQFDLKGDTQTIEDYSYGLKVTQGQKLYLLFEPLVKKDLEWFGFKAQITYTGYGEDAAATNPENKEMGSEEEDEGLTIRFARITGQNNGANGLTFYYTADGKKLTPFTQWDSADEKWWQGGGGLLVYPRLVPKDNYGVFGTSASEYVVLGYDVPATGTIDIYNWTVLQSGHDYQLLIARDDVENIIKKVDVRGDAQTVVEANTQLDVKRGDTLYFHYKPLEPADGAWGGYKVQITYLTGGEDYAPFAPEGTIAPKTSGEDSPGYSVRMINGSMPVIYFTQLATEENPANDLGFYWTSDGKTLNLFTEHEGSGTEFHWVYGSGGTLVYPKLVPADNYGLVGSSMNEYPVMAYTVPATGTISLYTWLALQSGHDYQIQIAKGSPDNILYVYDVRGASQTIVEQTTVMNVDAGDTIYILYKPLEVANGAWAGFKTEISYLSLGEKIGPEDPDPITPDPGQDDGEVQVGDTFRAPQLAPRSGENGATAMDLYYTTDGSSLTLFENFDPNMNSGRWWLSDGQLRAFVDPFAGNALLGSSKAAYVVLGYKMPASGRISMKNILNPNTGYTGKALVCKNSLSSIKAVLDFGAQSTYETELSVAKDDMIYVWYRTPNAPAAADQAFFTYYCEYTYLALGTFPDTPDVTDDEGGGEQGQVEVGDTFTAPNMAPKGGKNGTTAMDICYTTDGATVTLFQNYDPNMNSGRWWNSDGKLRAFVDPFAGNALLGSSNAAYVVLAYKIPADGKISMKNILLPNSGVSGKALVCKNSLSNVKATLDFAAQDTYVTELSVLKGDVIYVWYRTPNAPDAADQAFFTYYCEYTYTDLGIFPE